MRVDVTSRRTLRVRVVGLAAVVAAAATLAACTSGSPASSSHAGGASPVADGSSSAASAPASSPSSTPAIITTSVTTAQKINPTSPVTVSIEHGTLSKVVMTNAAGKAVTGAFSADKSSWHNTEDLGYSKTYQIEASGTNADGTPTVQHQTVTTLTPNNQTAVYMDRTGDYALQNGATYGVAIVPEMYFDEPMSTPAAKAAAVKALTVTTTPHVDGSWAWQDNQRVLFRPENYWPSGTKVNIAANIYGVDFGNGLYGQSDEQTSFTIGRKQVTIAVDSAPKAVNKVRVYNAAGQVIRTMNTSMGEHGGVTVPGTGYINFYTLSGTYTVLEHDNPAYMSSASYGLPASSPQGYASEPIYWSTKISVDGIYLHELDTTVWAQNSGQDVSHGCLNLDEANAQWFYQHSLIGDPVVVQGNKNAPKIQVWQGGAWSVPWSTWQTGNLS